MLKPKSRGGEAQFFSTMLHDHQDAIAGPHFDAGLVSVSGHLVRLHKGGGVPKQSKSDLRRQQKQDAMFAEMMSQGSKIKAPEMPVIPAAPKPEPVPPAPTASSADVEDAKAEQRRNAAKRYGLLKTTNAGATGGYAGATPMGGSNQRSLLG